MLEFKKEEIELEKSKILYEEHTISDDLANQAILEGMKRARNLETKKKKFAPTKLLLIASILIIAFITTIKNSEAMADYMASIPGMETIVKFIRQDKGLLAAAENDYFQKVNISDEHGGIKVTIDSIIHDERNLMVFFQYEAINKDHDFFLEKMNLLTLDKEILPNRPDFSSLEKDGESLRVAKFPLKENEELPDKLIASFEFSENVKMLDRAHEVAFSIDKEKFAEKEVYQLNETISVEGQKITVKELTLYPSQADVHLEYDEKNSKRLFGFNDIELTDGSGRVWRPYKDKSFNLDNEKGTILQLESPYFSNPEELYLRFSSIRAVEKDELWVEIDPVQRKILKAPKDGKITGVFLRKDELAIKVETNFDFLNNQIFMYAEDLNGNIIGDGKPFGAGGSHINNYVTYHVPYPSEEAVQGPIRLKLLDYPATIHKDAKLKVK